MGLEGIVDFAEGFLVSIPTASLAEWTIHNHMLHAPKPKRNFFTKGPAESHNDEHHSRYDGKKHYYQDSTNKEAVIQFSNIDRALILASSGLISQIGEMALNNMGAKYSLARGVGFTVGAMTYYAVYETTHNLMHVLEEERFKVGKILGDLIQQDKPDGNLRMPKPLLDEVRTQALKNLNSYRKSQDTNDLYNFSGATVNRLNLSLEYNIEQEVLQTENLSQPREYLEKMMYKLSLEPTPSLWQRTKAEVREHIRNSPLFKFIDNHHFVHHQKYTKNLNVVLPLGDALGQTMLDSSIKKLYSSQNTWICPNSPS